MKLDMGGLEGPAHAYLITGDGPRELRLVERIVDKLNHSKVIKVPTGAGLHSGRFGGATGVVAVANALSTLLGMRLSIARYIVIIDREHANDISAITNVFPQYGIQVLENRQLQDGCDCWRILVQKGDKKATVYVSIMGYKKSIEEHIATLIKLKYGEEVDHSSVYEWLKKKMLNDKELVNSSDLRLLREAFSPLVKTLEAVKNED